MKKQDFFLHLTNADNEVLNITHIAVIDDWENVEDHDNFDLEYDHVFDMKEIRSIGKSVKMVPDIEERICQVLYNKLKDDSDKLDDTMHGRK